MVTVYVPADPLLGEPDRTPVLALNDTPWGSPPDNEYDGEPLALTWKWKK
jgi:hypothetical protein